MSNKIRTENLSPRIGKGRPKGSPNKTATAVKDAIKALADGNAHKVQEWLDLVALGNESLGIKPAPDKAVDLWLKMLEYNIPKLGRTEVTGKDGDDVKVSVSWLK
jgi:hypothetical protein